MEKAKFLYVQHSLFVQVTQLDYIEIQLSLFIFLKVILYEGKKKFIPKM